jgi:hypothetical protein
MLDMDFWLIATTIYFLIAFITLIPVLAAMVKKKKKFKPRPDPFGDARDLGVGMKERLNDHFSRIEGALHYWNNRAEWNRRFHYYTLCWTLSISIVIPVMVTFVDIESYAKIFIILISLHSALLLAFHRALKIENNYKAFRYGKSEFCDIYRRMLDNPGSFGKNSDEQLNAYFAESERIRKFMRSAEIDNFPGLEEKGEPKKIEFSRNLDKKPKE